MKTPTFYGRPMVLVKKYKYFVLYRDKKTGIKEAFRYWDLCHETIDNQIYFINNKGEYIPIEEVNAIAKSQARLLKLINSNDKKVNQ